MKKLLITVLLLLGSVQAAGAEAKMCPSVAVGEAVKQTVAGKATGVVLVAQGGCILWRGGIGDTAKGIPPPQPDTIFDALSIGKIFTAIAVQELANQRRIELASPIRRYVPKLPEAYGDITIQDALDNNGASPLICRMAMTPRHAQRKACSVHSRRRCTRAKAARATLTRMSVFKFLV